MSLQDIAALAGGLGLGSVLTTLIPLIWRRLTGKEARRRSDAEKAWEQRDEQARRRRIVEEHAHVLRRKLIEADCIEPKDIPPWPYRGSDKKE